VRHGCWLRAQRVTLHSDPHRPHRGPPLVIPTTVGDPAADAFTDTEAHAETLATFPVNTRIIKRRAPELFAWRYGLEPLGYRVGARHTGLSDGFAVFRCRPWGKAIECVLCDVVVPEDDQRLTDELIDKVQKAAPADYIIRLDQRRVTRGPFVRLPRVGPILTCRPLDAFPAPELGRWRPTVGDVELF